MRSLERIKKDSGLSYYELCNAFRDCISYYLSEVELENFLIKVKEQKIMLS